MARYRVISKHIAIGICYSMWLVMWLKKVNGHVTKVNKRKSMCKCMVKYTFVTILLDGQHLQLIPAFHFQCQLFLNLCRILDASTGKPENASFVTLKGCAIIHWISLTQMRALLPMSILIEFATSPSLNIGLHYIICWNIYHVGIQKQTIVMPLTPQSCHQNSCSSHLAHFTSLWQPMYHCTDAEK